MNRRDLRKAAEDDDWVARSQQTLSKAQMESGYESPYSLMKEFRCPRCEPLHAPGVAGIIEGLMLVAIMLLSLAVIGVTLTLGIGIILSSLF